jgi:hypothetical protein
MNDDKPAKPEIPMNMHENHEKDAPRLGKEIQSRIGQQLRAMYDDVVKEGVPDRFADLLRKMEAPGGSAGRPDSGDKEGSRG